MCKKIYVIINSRWMAVFNAQVGALLYKFNFYMEDM
jgi:hypothetical protein